jgi:hypothetical protein
MEVIFQHHSALLGAGPPALTCYNNWVRFVSAGKALGISNGAADNLSPQEQQTLLWKYK